MSHYYFITILLAIPTVTFGLSNNDNSNLDNFINAEQFTKLVNEMHIQNERMKDISEDVEKLKELSKLQVIRTCEEMYNFGIRQSNHYFIDPDGPLIGQEPIQVYCRFTNEGAYTEISHDSEIKIEVDHCHDPGCYSRKINYDAPIQQIQALIELSKYCEQNIRYDCLLSPLTEEGVNLAHWLDRTGDYQIY